MSASIIAKQEAKARCLSAIIRKLEPSCYDPTKFMKHQIENVFVCLRNNIQQPWNDWKLNIANSNIENGGRGLFIEGHAPAGRLLAMYAGAFWPEEDITSLLNELNRITSANNAIKKENDKISDRNENNNNTSNNSEEENELSYIEIERQNEILTIFDSLFSNNYTYSREDGTLLDASPCEKLYDKIRLNPLAMGQYCNHPSIKYNNNIPNIMAIDVPWNFTDLTINKNAELERKYVPTWYHNYGDGNSGKKYNKYSNESIFDSKITCFVAIKDVKNEELFFDYEFEGLENDSVPQWFNRVDEQIYLDIEKQCEEQNEIK